MKNAICCLTFSCFLFHSTIVISQECSHVAGDWDINTDEAYITIYQNPATGSLSGWADPVGCQSGWEVTGEFDDFWGEFELTAVNPNGPYDPTYWCAPWVKLRGDVDEPGCHEVLDVELENPAGKEFGYHMFKDCDVPNSESSVPLYWGTGDSATSLMFGVVFNGSGNEYAGRIHEEWTDSQVPAYDNCGYPGYIPWVTLQHTNGNPVTIPSTYPSLAPIQDLVGRKTFDVSDIRTKGQTPCDNQFGQAVKMSCDVTVYDHYHTNILGYVVGGNWVWSGRHDGNDMKLWP